MASNAPDNWIGVGGAPGESVYVGIGATKQEPQNIITSSYYRINLNAGSQAASGPDRKVIGNFANGTARPEYAIIQRAGEFSFTSDATGEAWVWISLDSGFEATTRAYITSIKVDFFKL